MAALDPANTPRAYLTYNVDGVNHTMMVRVSDDASDGVISENIGAFLEAMTPLVDGSLFVKFERSDEGSNVRVPAVWSGPTEWGTGTGDGTRVPLFYSFTGKDVSGHKGRVELYGRNNANNANWRVFGVDDTSIAAALDALETSDPVFNTIGGVGAIWNQYANQTASAYWQRKSRVS